MKQLKDSFLLAFLIIFCIGCTGNEPETGNNNGDDPDPDPDPETETAWLTNEKIPIMAWFSIPASETSLERYQELADAGFTHNLMAFSSHDQLDRAMDAANAVGVKMMLWYTKIDTETASTVNRFKNHPAMWAYFVMDEPEYKDFAGCAAMSQKITALDDTHFCYVNLYPLWSASDTWGASSYREYVRGAIEQIPNLEFISFDHYMVRLNTSNGSLYLNSTWENNYRIVSEEAQRAGMPFWTFICSIKWAAGIPKPSLNSMRWYAYTALAYGSQGIQYYTYEDDTNLTWSDAPYDYSTRQKTETYYFAQELNREIQNFAKVFLNATVLEVKHTGTPNDAHRLEQAPAVFKTFETGTTGAVTSLLEKGDKMFFVVVNRDVNLDLEVRIEADESVRQVTKYGTLKMLDGLQTEKLTPGDIRVYTWPKEEN